jgi:predicted transcriptional regulator|tara:strand:+ start:2338 stop:2613 length:276 start_codon:yes stop_codon:yes gene_type:complete
MASQGLAITNIGRTLMTSSKKIHEYGWLEAKQSGGAVYEQGVRESKKNKAVRRIAEPLTEKHWRNTGQSVTALHRIYRIAEYLYKRSKRHK